MRRALFVALTVVVSATCTGQAGDMDGAAAEATAAAVPANAPTEAERAEILAVLQQVFDALASGEGDVLRDAMAPNVTMDYVAIAADGTVTFGASDLDGLVTRVETSEVPLIERMWDAEVRISGSMATIWTPYDFYAGTEFSHCGADAATLMHTADGWRVTSLSWTRLQPPACPLHPEGPPTG